MTNLFLFLLMCLLLKYSSYIIYRYSLAYVTVFVVLYSKKVIRVEALQNPHTQALKRFLQVASCLQIALEDYSSDITDRR